MGPDRYDAPGVGTSDPGALAGFGFAALPVVRVTLTDPAVSRAQASLMGADLARKRAGKKTRTALTEAQLREFAAPPHKDLPERARRSSGRRRG